MRVHELAKELGVSSKELMARAQRLGREAKSHMAALDEATVAQLRAEATASTAAAAPPPTPSPPPSAPEPAPPSPPAPPPPVAATPSPASVRTIRMRGAIVVKDLAERLNLRPNKLIAELMSLNVLASINERLDFNDAKKIAEKHGYVLEHEKKPAEHPVPKKRGGEDEDEEDRPEDLLPRPPVVTFMGHVDHGKTSLLDRIRHSAVAKGEHGGITQHLGAYTVDLNGRRITFLDTPGHAAFTAMRARGANLTDIAVIVIAADDGVMPQTQEAISHAKAAGVAIMVAVNKIDLPTANLDRIKQQLQTLGLVPEEWGGETVCCPVSAATGDGVDHLLEMILLQADMLELRANPSRRARGYVLEARLEAGMGPTANLLVKAGTLRVGDVVLCGRHCGRVKALISDQGVKVKEALPSMPVSCLGLSGVPDAGAEFRVCANERIAREMAEKEASRLRDLQTATPVRKASLETLLSQTREGGPRELKLILKADTQGSIEAITHALKDIKSDKVTLSIIMTATGNITVNDVMLASASNGVIVGFHVAKEPGVDAAAKHEGVEIRLHTIIYELLDQVRAAMAGLLAPVIKEVIRGHARVKQIFPIGKTAKVAGCVVTDGMIASRFKVRVKRGKEVLYEGALLSLKHFKESVSEVRENQECGLRLDRYSDFIPGDVIEFYEQEEIAQTL